MLGQSAPRLTAKQQALVDYLREHPNTRQDDLAKALGSTLRGVGVILSALTWHDDVTLVHARGDGGAESDRWSVRG
jgi:predicted transcriptional regulator